MVHVRSLMPARAAARRALAATAAAALSTLGLVGLAGVTTVATPVAARAARGVRNFVRNLIWGLIQERIFLLKLHECAFFQPHSGITGRIFGN